MFYFCLIICIILLIPIQFKIKKIKQVIYLLILSIIAGFRYGIGTDYFAYSRAYYNFNLFDLHTLMNNDFGMEKGYIILNKSLGMISNDSQIIFLVCSFITMFLIIKSSADYCKNYELSILLFIMLGYYHSSFNTIRQYIAISIFLFSIRYISSKQFLKYLICILIASTFHVTSICLLLIYFVGNKNYSKTFLFLFSTLSLFINYFYEFIIIKILPLVSKYYAIKYKGSIWLQSGVGGRYNYILIALLYILILICLYNKEKLDKFKYGNFVVNMVIISLALLVLGTRSLLMFRLSLYFSIFLIVLVPTITELFKDNKLKIVVCFLVIIISSYCYIYTLSARDEVIPYRFNYNYITSVN